MTAINSKPSAVETLPARLSSSQNPSSKVLQGAGLGFRRELLPKMAAFEQAAFEKTTADVSNAIDFFELSPENWLNKNGRMGGRYDKQLRAYTERFAFVCHGLSLSIGSSAVLDTDLLCNIKQFMQAHDIKLYTEHLSWCSDVNGHMYDLLPIPCTQEAVYWVANRIKQAQDILGQQIGFENASYYFVPEHSDMSDAEFITAVVNEADCLLHLDINNIYVNSQNFGFDAHEYLRQLPVERTCYVHVAGHQTADDGLIIDTHGESVVDGVWALLADAYRLIEHKTGKPANSIPTCLERDSNFPEFEQLIAEVQTIKTLQTQTSQHDSCVFNVQSIKELQQANREVIYHAN